MWWNWTLNGNTDRTFEFFLSWYIVIPSDQCSEMKNMENSQCNLLWKRNASISSKMLYIYIYVHFIESYLVWKHAVRNCSGILLYLYPTPSAAGVQMISCSVSYSSCIYEFPAGVVSYIITLHRASVPLAGVVSYIIMLHRATVPLANCVPRFHSSISQCIIKYAPQHKGCSIALKYSVVAVNGPGMRIEHPLRDSQMALKLTHKMGKLHLMWQDLINQCLFYSITSVYKYMYIVWQSCLFETFCVISSGILF